MYKLFFLFTFLCIISCKKETPSKLQKSIKTTTVKTPIKKFFTPLSKNIVLGKFNYKKDTNFIKVAKKHSSKTLFLHKKTYDAFCKMYLAAKNENIDLKIISGTRSFFEQKYIWERKWKKYNKLPPLQRAQKILEYSSMPSSSRHHWGTDMDINNLNNSYFEKGKGKKEYEWLVKNAAKYGFYQVYTSKENGRTGYNTEKWHWSYIPLAKEYLHFYNEAITYQDITGFKGAELAKKIGIITNYINGINPKVKQH